MPVLSIIFKTSSQTCCLPSKWKEANTKAIYKKQDKHDQEKYCPISLANLIWKIMDSLKKIY